MARIISRAVAATGMLALLMHGTLKAQNIEQEWERIQEALRDQPAREVRNQLRRFLRDHGKDLERSQRALELLGQVQLDLLLSTSPEPGNYKRGHLVEPGDSLRGIAMQYNSTPAAIVRCNNMLSATIKPGDRLIVPVLPTTAELRLEDGRLIIELGGKYLCHYDFTVEPHLPDELVLPAKLEVRDKTSWYDGQSLTIESPHYWESTRWVQLRWKQDTDIVLYALNAADRGLSDGQKESAREGEEGGGAGMETGATEGTDSSESPEAPDEPKKPRYGVELPPEVMEEVFLLLTGQSIVSLEK